MLINGSHPLLSEYNVLSTGVFILFLHDTDRLVNAISGTTAYNECYID